MRIKIDNKYIPSIGKSSVLYIKNKEICLINQSGIIYAIDNECPHAGASLSMGKCIGDWLVCPMHDIRFNIKNGKGQTEKFSVQSYMISIEDENYFIDIN